MSNLIVIHHVVTLTTQTTLITLDTPLHTSNIYILPYGLKWSYTEKLNYYIPDIVCWQYPLRRLSTKRFLQWEISIG